MLTCFSGYKSCSTSTMIDLDNRFASNGVALSLRMTSVLTSGIMMGGFLTSVAFAVIFNFHSTTKTHCGVPNYLPSISAAIADPPSSYVWRLSVTMCSAQRLGALFCHYAMYSSIPLERLQYRWLCYLMFFSELMENLGLIGLTCVSSVDNHQAHEYFFIIFQASAMLYMMLMCMVHYQAISYGVNPSHEETKTLMRKVGLFLTNLVAFCSALYFYYRHNRFCEPGVYTIFAFLEYVVVASNIAFHFLVTCIFGDREMRMGCRARSQH